MPTRVDIDVWIGNSLPPIEWSWPDGYAGTAACELTIWTGPDQVFSAAVGSGLIVDTIGRRFIWDRTVEQSRLIPTGRIARYELEDQIGGELTVFYGAVVGKGGLNDDVGPHSSDGSLRFSNPQNSGLSMMGWI